MPPPAIRPECSAGRTERPRELLDPMLWQGGKEVIHLQISLKNVAHENEYF